MHYVYILHSHSIQEYYCGQTNNLEDRMRRHNAGESKSIKHGIPWKLVAYKVVSGRQEAVRLEREIKKRGIKRWLDAHIKEVVQPG